MTHYPFLLPLREKLLQEILCFHQHHLSDAVALKNCELWKFVAIAFCLHFPSLSLADTFDVIREEEVRLQPLYNQVQG